MEQQSKKVLVVYFSQTGQLRRVLDGLIAPLQESPSVQVDWLALQPSEPYPFPWPFFRFLEEFPEAVRLRPPPLAPFRLDSTAGSYDVVVLGYTVWYLSPSPPITAFLKSSAAREILRGKPVITVVTCRNMWTTAQQTVRRYLDGLGARLSDHVAFVDSGPPMATFITTPRWMFTGRKDRWLGLPPAGVSSDDIQHRGTRLGKALRQAVEADQVNGYRPVLSGLEAARADEGLIMSERIGQRSFRIWSRLVGGAGPKGSWRRRFALAAYLAFLLVMIVTVVPISLMARKALRPVLARRLTELRQQHEAPSGSDNLRTRDFD